MKRDQLIWALFFSGRLAALVVTTVLVGGMTQLGDTERYLQGLDEYVGLDEGAVSTWIMFALGGMFNFSGIGLLANLPCLAIFSAAVYWSANRLNLAGKDLIAFLILMSLPSISIWTTIHSKEAIVGAASVVIGTHIVRILRKDQTSLIPGWVELLALLTVAVFKPQFMAAIAPAIVGLTLLSRMRVGAMQVLAVLAYPIGTVLLAIAFSPLMNDLAFELPRHFHLEARSTRPNDIWLEENDIFLSAPYGMLISFVGPTIEEATRDLLSILAFSESMLLLLLAGLVVIRQVRFGQGIRLTGPQAILLLTSLAVLLFVHYPLGALNPGSAIRYRTGFLPMLIIIFFCLNSKYSPAVQRIKLRSAAFPRSV